MFQQFKSGNRIFVKAHPDLQNILAEAYHNKERPACMCKRPGVEMYIAKIGSYFALKRMPNSGHKHHPECDSFQIPSELSGRGALVDKAIAEDKDTGFTTLKLDFSLSKIASNKSLATGESTESTGVTANPEKLSIRSLLHCLYEDAGLNRWSPRMKGKRSWGIIHKFLYQSARSKLAKNALLTDRLLIPETFNLERKVEIENHRRSLLAKLKPQAKRSPVGILIGEVKSFDTARFGQKLVIKHMPEKPAFVTDDLYKRLSKRFSKEFAFFREYENIHLIIAASFVLSEAGSVQIESASFMLADENWLPFENEIDQGLNSRLVSSNRNFIKGLRYNLPSSDVIASALLTDTENGPTAIYIVPDEPANGYRERLEAAIEASELQSHICDYENNTGLDMPPRMNQSA